MNTKQLFTLAAGLLLTACAQNEIINESPDANPPVSFDVYTGVQSRGAETTLSTVQATGFGIFGYYTGADSWASAGTPNYMFDQKASYEAEAWSYTPVKYWPNKAGDKVTFFAYAPHSSSSGSGITTSSSATEGSPYLDFTVQADASKSVDLVTASALDQAKSSSPVSFTFGHALSRAQFFAKASENLSTGSHVFIRSVKIVGSTNNIGSKFYTRARYTLSDGTWDYSPGNAAISEPDYDLAGILAATVQTDMGGYGETAVDVTGTVSTSLFSTGAYFFFIPVANATGTAADDVKVEITYDIVTVDPSLNAGHSKASNTVTVPLPTGTLQKGAAYNFNFEVSLSQINVTATSVTGWGTATDSPVPLP